MSTHAYTMFMCDNILVYRTEQFSTNNTKFALYLLLSIYESSTPATTRAAAAAAATFTVNPWQK